jgi:monoterpene epsilon-lactone hydrolase
MVSLRSRLLILMLKHRHLLRLRWRRRPVDASTSIVELRRRADASAGMFGRMPAGMRAQPVTIGGVPAEWIHAHRCDDGRTLLYFHGGGYVMGSCRSHRNVVAKFAAAAETSAVLFDYRLAPEHPFPAALDDALAVYAGLLARGYRASGIAFAGDSAGGGLCLATLLALRQRGLPMPAAAVVLSPWTDLTCSSPSYQRPDPLAPPGSWTTFGAHYAGGCDASDPLISPLFGDPSGLPPLLIYVGEEESMRDDSVRFADNARRAGVDVRLHVGPGMIHCYPAFAPIMPEAKTAMREIGAFIRERTRADDADPPP